MRHEAPPHSAQLSRVSRQIRAHLCWRCGVTIPLKTTGECKRREDQLLVYDVQSLCDGDILYTLDRRHILHSMV